MEIPTAENLMFHAQRNAQYHVARRGKLERQNRYATAITILLGATVVAEAAGQVGINIVWIGIATSVVGVAQIVFDFGGRARTHEMLQRRYCDLIAAMLRKGPAPTTSDIAEWSATIALISGDEPPPDPVAEADAYNAAGNALGMSEDDVLFVPWRLRLISVFFNIGGGYRFETRGEREKKRRARTMSRSST